MNPEVAAAISESDFQEVVGDMLTSFGWRWIHSRAARRKGEGWIVPVSGNSTKGWPDVFAIRDTDVLVLELKSERGRLTEDQRGWITVFRVAGIDAHVIRPSDLDWLEGRLKPQSAQLSWEGNDE